MKPSPCRSSEILRPLKRHHGRLLGRKAYHGYPRTHTPYERGTIAMTDTPSTAPLSPTPHAATRAHLLAGALLAAAAFTPLSGCAAEGAPTAHEQPSVDAQSNLAQVSDTTIDEQPPSTLPTRSPRSPAAMPMALRLPTSSLLSTPNPTFLTSAIRPSMDSRPRTRP